MPISKKDPEKSILSCEEVLRSDPSAVHVLLKLGEAASYANLNDVAIYTFERVMSVPSLRRVIESGPSAHKRDTSRSRVSSARRRRDLTIDAMTICARRITAS